MLKNFVFSNAKIYQQGIVHALSLMNYELDREEVAAIILHCL